MSVHAFQWRGMDLSDYGAFGDALMALRTREDAKDFWLAYVAYLSRPAAELGGNSPEHVARQNIGYITGYYGEEARLHVYGLFSTFSVTHPILGAI